MKPNAHMLIRSWRSFNAYMAFSIRIASINNDIVFRTTLIARALNADFDCVTSLTGRPFCLVPYTMQHAYSASAMTTPLVEKDVLFLAQLQPFTVH